MIRHRLGRLALPFLLVLLGGLTAAGPAAAQDAPPPEDPRAAGQRAIAQFENFRRANLPRYQGKRPAPSECQEQIGNICWWYDSTIVMQPEHELVTRARDRLITVLDSLGSQNPADNWIIGQRIRYLNEAGRDSAAYEVAKGCRSFGWWCAALEGFTLHALQRYAPAEAAYDRALLQMLPSERCLWRDISLYLDEDSRKVYTRSPCGDAERAASEARIWWYARTRYGLRGNDSRTEAFARLTYVEFMRDAPNGYAEEFSLDSRESILRFGWPVAWSRGADIIVPMGMPQPRIPFEIITSEKQPAFRLIPPHHVLTSPTVSDSTDWALQRPPVVARYHPPYATRVLMLEHQQALFRRGDSALLVLAYDVSKLPELTGAALEGALVLTPGRALLAFETIRTGVAARGTLTAMAPWGPLLMSAEIEAPDKTTLVRARYGIRPPYAIGSRVSLSDLLFYTPYGETPASVEDVLPHAIPTQRVRSSQPLGVYWEAYNTNPAGEPMTISLTVVAETEEVGLLRRGARALRLARESSPVSVTIADVSARGLTMTSRAVQVDISTLRRGEYLVQIEISVAGQYTIRADRRIVVTGP